jgi:MFS family permease
MRRWLVVGSQALAAVAILGLGLTQSTAMTAVLLCAAGIATASLSLNLYAIGQMFSGREAAGTWVGIQNAFGNLSGIFGPIVSGILVQQWGYQGAFVVTAAVAAFGALWWLVGVPKIEPVELD